MAMIKTSWKKANEDDGPIEINEIDLPENIKVGEVYEKIDGKYVYNPDITKELDKIK